MLLALLLVTADSTLTLQDAVTRALASYPDTRIAALGRDEALARRASATGALFPRLRVEAGAQIWDRPMDISFTAQDDGPAPDLSILPEDFRRMLERMQEPQRVREQVTLNANVTIMQPLTGLYPLLEARKLEAKGVAVSDEAKRRIEHELAFKVVDAYVQALTAEAGARTADKGVELATQMLERAEQLAKVGMVANADVLRARVNLASTKEMQLQAKTGVELSRAALEMYVGTSLAGVELDHDAKDSRPSPSLKDALDVAASDRAELRELDARLGQADAAVHLARSQMVPSVALLGQYQATYGQKFALPHQIFFGAQLQWDVWEWGNKWYLIDAAKAKSEAAKLEREKLVQLLLLDVRQAHTKHAIAAEQVAAATLAREAAKELFDNEQGRYGAGQVSATDLTLAQATYLQAENNLAAAKYRTLLARAGLDRAMGRRPLE